ncbi:MAG: hypothetical protein HYX79_04660 [Chloroflexi bacterium]|nr:hypothetical protein [Chloroflexota bacterium]
MERQEILLREYEACRQDITDTSSRYWTIVGIFIPVDILLLGGAGFLLKTNSPPMSFGTQLLVTLLGLGVILILFFLWRWLKRINYYIIIGWQRIHEIEANLEMLKNRTIYWLDNPKEIPYEQQARLTRITDKFGHPPTKEMCSLKGIFWTLSALWTLFILFTWIFPILKI